jgi:5-methylcytosine-specific restriction endonuclease McrA
MWWVKRKSKKIDPFSTRDKFHRFYVSKEWQTLRLYKLSINPLCEICEREHGYLNPGEHVDHIIPLAEDYELRLSLGNTQTLCPSCHSKKTKQEQALKKQREIDSNMEELNDFL